MEETPADVIPADGAEEFYFTACLANFTSEDLQVLLALYACLSHTCLTWAQCRELTTFGGFCQEPPQLVFERGSI
jgi:hypothetical protein